MQNAGNAGVMTRGTGSLRYQHMTLSM